MLLASGQRGAEYRPNLPQISIILKQNDVAAVSSATWLLFAVSNSVTAVYAAQIVADTAMAMTFTANTACCITI